MFFDCFVTIYSLRTEYATEFYFFNTHWKGIKKRHWRCMKTRIFRFLVTQISCIQGYRKTSVLNSHFSFWEFRRRYLVTWPRLKPIGQSEQKCNGSSLQVVAQTNSASHCSNMLQPWIYELIEKISIATIPEALKFMYITLIIRYEIFNIPL